MLKMDLKCFMACLIIYISFYDVGFDWAEALSRTDEPNSTMTPSVNLFSTDTEQNQRIKKPQEISSLNEKRIDILYHDNKTVRPNRVCEKSGLLNSSSPLQSTTESSVIKNVEDTPALKYTELIDSGASHANLQIKNNRKRDDLSPQALYEVDKKVDPEVQERLDEPNSTVTSLVNLFSTDTEQNQRIKEPQEISSLNEKRLDILFYDNKTDRTNGVGEKSGLMNSSSPSESTKESSVIKTVEDTPALKYMELIDSGASHANLQGKNIRKRDDLSPQALYEVDKKVDPEVQEHGFRSDTQPAQSYSTNKYAFIVTIPCLIGWIVLCILICLLFRRTGYCCRLCDEDLEELGIVTCDMGDDVEPCEPCKSTEEV